MAKERQVRSAPSVHSRRRRAAAVLAFSLAAGVISVPARATAADQPLTALAPPAAAVESAVARAAVSGVPVEVLSQRSDRARVWANPSGTMTVESSVLPRWVRRGDGSWTDIDTRLGRVDGGLVPAAVLADVSFSAGGAGPFVTLRRDGHTFTLSWPGWLPVPTVAGDAATYADVLSGVDLVVRATAEGFSHVLVVRTAAAAADPALRQVRLDVGGDVTVSTTAEGGLRVAAGATVVATAGGAVMWDSTTAAAAASSLDGPAAGPAVSSPVGPAESARIAGVDLTVAGGDLLLIPDAGLLAGGVFPVFVDPDFAAGPQSSTYANSANINHAPTDPVVQSGEPGGAQVWAGLNPNPGSGGIFRGFVQFPMVANYDLRGKRILSGKLHGVVDHTWKCGYSREVLFYRSAAIAATPRQAWPGPALQVGLGSVYAHANEQSCSEGNVPFEIVLTGDLQTASSGNWGTYTVAVVAQNEGNGEHWFRLVRGAFVLTATFNTAPATPTNLKVENTVCGASAVFVPSATPKLQAHIFDPDGDTDLTAQYAWDRFNTTTSVWDRIGDFYKTGQASNTDPFIRPGVDHGAALQHGGRYRFTTATLDPWSHGGSSGTDYSGWAPWCEFEVDLQNPSTTPGVSSTVYPQYQPGVDEDYHGGVGQTEPFTFTAGGVTDVNGFRWGWSDPPTTYVPAATLGGQATAQLTPPPPFPAFPTRKGQLTLHVRSIDRAGRQGPVNAYPMRVARAADPAGQWQLADPAGATTLTDSTTNGTAHPATPTAVTTGAPGRLLSGPAQTAPTAASFNGTTSHATTGMPVINTSKSFTIAAWVKLANTNYYATVVAQDGNRQSGFALQYSQDVNRFSMTMVATDLDNTSVIRGPVAPAPPRLNVWTHLVGVYDHGAGQLLLYVDGKLTGTVSHRATWAAGGGLTIGRAKWNGNPIAFWPGQLAEVNGWQRVVSAGEAAAMAATQVGAWSLDSHGGDDTTWGRSLTPTGGVTWAPGKIGDAATFNGSTGSLTTSGPAIRTDQSFTITGWVRLANKSKSMAMIGQDGTRASGFAVGYEPALDRLAFVMYSADVDNPVYTVVWSPSAPQAGTWLHVAAVHDATTAQMRLYINGEPAGATTYATAWHATGPLAMGRFRYNGTPTNYFPGSLDDVRVYAGALPDTEILKLFQP